MKIQLKRSNVLEGGVAKKPTASQMEYGELAVNYNNNDPALFIKDSTDAIVQLNSDTTYTAETGKGIAINASNEISIGNDWSNIPTLVP